MHSEWGLSAAVVPASSEGAVNHDTRADYVFVGVVLGLGVRCDCDGSRLSVATNPNRCWISARRGRRFHRALVCGLAEKRIPPADNRRKRYAGTPSIPTISETLPGFHAPPSWFGFFGPPGMSQPVVDKLNTEIRSALKSIEISDKIRSLNLNFFPTRLDEVRSPIAESTETFGQPIKVTKIKPID